jgi:tetratricopeptide (TPR) repeat protein
MKSDNRDHAGSRLAPPFPGERKILESWKEIAAHLNRNIRTCQMWEREMGLPIHRLDGSPKARVFAYRDELDRWLDEKLHEREADAPAEVISAPKKTFVLAGAALVMIVAAAGLAWLVFGRNDSASSAKSRPSIAVLNFENLSGDFALDLWREGLARLLNIELSQSKLIGVVDPSSLYGILKKLRLDETVKFTREDLIKVADEGNATLATTGSLMKIGESIVIMMTLQKPRTGEVVESIKLTCRNESELVFKADELAARIKAALRLTPAQLAADAGRGIQELTTGSPEAMKYYLESYEKFRLLDYAKTRGLLEKAIGLDPNFAMAYILLAVSFESDRNYAKGRELRKKAFDLRDRLPESERYKVEANHYMTLPGEDSRAKAINAYEKYFEYAPRDAGELQSLGMLYENNGEYSQSLECHRRAYEADPSPQYLLGVLFGLQHTGRLEEAAEALKDFQGVYQGSPFIQWCATYLQVSRRKFDQAFEEIDRGFLLDPAPNWSWDCFRGDVLIARGDLAEAERTYLGVIEKAEKPEHVLLAKSKLIALCILQGKTKRGSAEDLSAALAWQGTGGQVPGLINAYLRLKNFDKASEYLERSLSASRKLQDPLGIRRWLWWKGIAAIERHDLAEAERAAAELESSAQKSPYRIEMRKVEHLQGLIELEKGEYAQAIVKLKKASSWLPSELLSRWMETQTLHYYPLGLAYFQADDLPRARTEFERVTNLAGSKFWFGDLYAKSVFMLGRIAEEQEDPLRAVENYRRFLEL